MGVTHLACPERVLRSRKVQEEGDDAAVAFWTEAVGYPWRKADCEESCPMLMNLVLVPDDSALARESACAMARRVRQTMMMFLPIINKCNLICPFLMTGQTVVTSFSVLT